MTRDSGQCCCRARTKGGRRARRTVLHLAAITAMTRNPDRKTCADRLRKRGKHTCAVSTATLRKLRVLANPLAAENSRWTEAKP